MKTAEKVFDRLRSAGDTALVDEARLLLIAELEKRQLGMKAEKYRKGLTAPRV